MKPLASGKFHCFCVSGFVLFIIQLFFVATRVSASELDSLKRVAEQMSADTNKVKLLSDLCFYHRTVSSDSALRFGNEALSLARQLKWEKGIAQANNDIAIVYMDLNEYDQAMAYLNKALSIRKRLGDEMGEAAIYNKFGIIYQEKFQLKEALDYNYKALRIYEKYNHKFYLSYVLNNIGILHFNLREYDKAVEMHQKALALRKEMNDQYGIAASYGNLANVYYESKDTTRAIENWKFAIENFRALNKPEELAVQLNNYGGLLVVRGEYKKAIPLLQEAYELRKQLNDRKAISSVLISLGEAQMMQGKYTDARRSLNEALTISREINTGHEKLFSYMKLAKLFTFTHNADSAYFYMSQYAALKDTIFNDELKKEVAEVRIKYETEKKENELLQERARNANLARDKAESDLKVSNRNKWIYGISGLGLAALFFVLFMAQRRNRKLQSEKDAAIILEREKGLQSVIIATENERKRIARELHDGIGQQLGGLKLAWQQLEKEVAGTQQEEFEKLKSLTRILDDTAAEVRSISHQMMPKVLSELGLIPALEDMLKKTFLHTGILCEFEHYGVASRPEETIEISLYRICQELINNIIKHSGATQVVVQLFKNKNHLILVVEDNGKGFDYEGEKEGIGLMNIATRLSTVKGEVNYQSSPGNQGTVATVRVPFR